MILGAIRKNKSFIQKYIYSIKLKRLSEEILQLSPKQLNNMITKLLGNLEIGDFFGLTTSLSGINLLKPTKNQEVGKTQVFGQQ